MPISCRRRQVERLQPDARRRPDERYGRGPPGRTRRIRGSYGGFLAANRNKRSIGLDPNPRSVAVRVDCGISDVVYENFRPGVTERLGLGYEDCRAINPSVIYASASGYGQSGPYVDLPGQDILTQAIGGWGAMNADHTGRPVPVGMSITDVLGGMNGAIAVLAALVHRALTGEGQRVGTSLLESAVACQCEQAIHFMNTRREMRVGRRVMARLHPAVRLYATKDGHIALSSGRHIRQYCRILGIDDLSQDPRFNDYWTRRRTGGVRGHVESALKAKTTDEWVELMRAEDLFCAP